MEPEPSAETGPGSSFGSTFAPASQINSTTNTPTTSSSPSGSKNPYRQSSTSSKNGITTTTRQSGSPREKFPDYRAEAFGEYAPASSSSRRRDRASSHGNPPSYQEAVSPPGEQQRRRRGSSLKERYPGDKSHQPLDVIRRDSKKAYRSPHLHKRSLPGADMIDRLDPAIGGRAYHHEGPYDAALLSRNRDPKNAPLKALETSNEEALKATPRENIRDAVERHKPLDGVAIVPPGEADRFGRRYNYKEGDDLMHEPSSGDAGYKRWPGKDYDPDDLKGASEPNFSLDRALRAHTINENGIEMDDRSHLTKDYRQRERDGTLDRRDPVEIAGGQSNYVDMEIAAAAKQDGDVEPVKKNGHGSLRKHIGSLRKKNKDD